MPTGTAYTRGTGPAVLLTCLLTGALLLGACTSGAGSASELPSVSPSPAVSVSTTPSSSSPDPVVSSPAPTPTSAEAAVEAAVKAYYAAFDLAARTGKTDAYSRAVTLDCPCRDFITAVEATFEAGPVKGGGVDLKAQRVVTSNAQLATVSTKYRTLGYVAHSSKGTETVPDAVISSLLTLRPGSDGWLVEDEQILSRDAT
jgi:hypothetical protein